MAGLARILKSIGSMVTVDSEGRKVEWVYDYAAGMPVERSEMPFGSERWKASERAKYASRHPSDYLTPGQKLTLPSQS